MANHSMTAPGWYHGVGDPPNTQRWWDGSRWITEPCQFDSTGRYVAPPRSQPVQDRVRESFDFSGRSTRREFWRFISPLILIVVGCYYAGALLMDFGQGDQVRVGLALVVASGIIAVLSLVPGTAAGVRRLHDTNRSGWWMALALVPGVNYIGLPALIFFLTRPSALTTTA